MKALVTAEINMGVLKEVFPKMEFVPAGYCVNHEVMESSELAKIIAGYDFLISEFETVNQEVLEAADKLKMIICCRGGVRSVVDVAHAREKGILVAHNAGRNANAVSDLVIGFIIDMSRNITKTNELIHSGMLLSSYRNLPTEYKDTIWGLNDDSPYVRFRGKSLGMMTLGIVGYGNVGRLVAEKASAFGMDILIYDPIETSIFVSENVKSVDFETLLKQADVVTLHCPVTSKNRNMMSAKQFAMMKKGAYFINTARGGLVDENALVDALNHEHLAGAALDVSVTEPIPETSVLLNAKNLIITPHIAGASEDVIAKGTEMVIHKLMNYMDMDLVM